MRTMLQLPSSALWAAVSLLLVAAFQVPAVTQQGPDVTEGNWLVAGPFTGAGANALFKDHLSGPTAEQMVRARLGAVASQSPGGTTVWREAGRGPDGRIDFAGMWPGRGRAIAYAYTELSSPSAGSVVATLGSGNNIQVRLNGEVVYESRLSRKPEPDKDMLVLRLRRGINPLPVRFNAGGIAAGGEFFAGEYVGMVSVSPNPLNRERYALVVGGTTPRSFETAARLRPGELPDYVIFDRQAVEGEEPAFVAGGFFDKFWRPEASARAGLATR